jgi:hypothetical protein
LPFTDDTTMNINWPFAYFLFALFGLLNLRGIVLYVRGYRPAAFGLIALWLMAVMFLDLVRRRLTGEI